MTPQWVSHEDVRAIREEVQNLREELRQSYVTKDAFLPIQRVVYGMVTLILTSVVLGWLAFILKK